MDPINDRQQRIQETDYEVLESVQALRKMPGSAHGANVLLPLGSFKTHKCSLLPYPERMNSLLLMEAVERKLRQATAETMAMTKKGLPSTVPRLAPVPYFSLETVETVAEVGLRKVSSGSSSGSSSDDLVRPLQRNGSSLIGPFVCLGDLDIEIDVDIPDARHYHVVGHHVVAVRESDRSVWLIAAPEPDFVHQDDLDDSNGDDRVDVAGIVDEFTAAAPPMFRLVDTVKHLWTGRSWTELPLPTNLGTRIPPTIVNAGFSWDGQILQRP
ncbi:MAG: hypothetical protein M1826_001361 [Phylliscum demangeonii]|nr:MAG: hypothetical protein M1826_001361 [Phylliscum demangeonii]